MVVVECWHGACDCGGSGDCGDGGGVLAWWW